MRAKDWISVDDKLPKKTRYVIVCITYPGGEQIVTDAALVKEDVGKYQWYTSDGFPVEGVTHWMEIVLPKLKKYEI